MLNEGRGVEKNSDEARALLEASAEQGNMHAKYHLGVMYEYGRGGLKQNFNRAADLYEEAVKGRVLDAMYYLGLMYVQGRGRTQDSHRAIELFKMAAVKSHAPSLYALGKMYFDGEGTDIDYSLAASYFKKAGAQEDPRVREIADREAEQIELLLEQVENNIRQNEQQIGYPITVQIASVQ
jgi:TPR repeat protein